VGFSQTAVVSVNRPITSKGETHYSWTSSAPAGTWFQLYLNGVLAWYGQKRWADLPAATTDVHVDIGTVDAGEQYTDFSDALPDAPQRRARIIWTGGSFLDPAGEGDVAGFKVFGSSAPAGYGTGGYGQGGYGTGIPTVDTANPLATIPAYTGSRTDGYGMGGYGSGGYGSSAGSYSWESDALWSGTWTLVVQAFDSAGNLGASQEATVIIAVPPRPPGWRRPRPRLTYQLQGAAATLSWLPSPG